MEKIPEETQKKFFNAIEFRNIKLVKEMIQAESRLVNIRDRWGSSWRNALNTAVYKGDIEIVKLLVENGGKCENLDDSTDIHVAARAGNYEIVSLLLDRGVVNPLSFEETTEKTL